MTFPSKTLAVALMAAAIPLCSATAAPLSQSLALSNADVGTIEQVQYRRWNGNRWVGPAAGFAAGAIIGGALSSQAYNEGYYAYGAAPSGYYAYGAAPGYAVRPGYGYYRDDNYGNGSAATGPNARGRCPSDREDASAYPSWMCW